MLAVPLQFSCSSVQMRTEVFYHVCHVIYNLCKDASPKFTGKSEIFLTLFFFPTHLYENLNALWHWKLQSGTAVTSKMVWTLFFSLPVTENVLFTDTMQKAQHERWDLGGWWGRGASGQEVQRTASGDGGGGDWEQEVGEHIWCIQNTNGHEKLSSPCELRMHVKQAHAKSQWLSIGKWLSHASLAGRAAVWNWESKGLNPDRGLPH